jgi:hypothetical protein
MLSSNCVTCIKPRERGLPRHSNSKQACLQESLDIELQSTGRVLQSVLLKHSGVQDTESTNDRLLAGNADVDGGSVTGEVGGVL